MSPSVLNFFFPDFAVFPEFKLSLFLTPCILALVLFGTAAAYDEDAVERQEWQRAVRYHQGDGPVLFVRLPYDGHTTTMDRAALSGCTEPGAKVTVNGVPVLVHATGAFVGLLPLQHGTNEFEIVATKSGSKTRKVIIVKRPMPSKPVPANPPRIATERGMMPDEDMALKPGDDFTVRFTASPGGKAYFTIGDSKTIHPMDEIPPDESPEGIPGVYQGKYTVTARDRFDDADITVHLRIDGINRGVMTKGRLTTLPGKVNVRILSQEDASLEEERWPSETFAFLKEPTWLKSNGHIGRRYRVILPGREEPLWISKNDIAKIEKDADPEIAVLSAIHIKDIKSERETEVLFAFDRATTLPLPVLIESDRQGTELLIWGAVSGPADSVGDSSTSSTAFIKSTSHAGQTSPLRLNVNTRGDLWGFDYHFTDDGNLRLSLRHPPDLSQTTEAKPLLGLSVLLFAGHGGDNTGAIGPAGLRESDANLAIAKRLADLLRNGGATVEMPRTTDRYISLDDRARIIRKSHADFMLSIHNNAVSDYTAQDRVRGPLTYFTYGHQLPLAWDLYHRLPQIRSVSPSPSPVRQRAFRVTRKATQMPGVLIEALFLCHPEDEMLLLNTAYLDSLARELYKGLVASVSKSDDNTSVDAVSFAANKYKVQMKFFPDSAE